MSQIFPPFHWTNLLIIPGLLLAYTVHELGHALTAYFLGDYSQVETGKISLNPFRHVSWFGTIAFVLFGSLGFIIFGIFGHSSLQNDVNNFKQKHLGLCLSAISGPIASFTLGIFAVLLTLVMAATLVQGSGTSTDEILLFLFPDSDNLPQSFDLQALTMALTSYLAVASFCLAFVSILPLPGLDGLAFIVNFIAFFRDRKKSPQPKPNYSVSKPMLALVDTHRRRNNVSDIHFKAGADYHQANKFDDAIARYRQAINNDNRFGPAYVNLGLAYLGKGKRREAIHAFRGAIQYADDSRSQQEAWYQLHQLSQVSPIEDPQTNLTTLGNSPWTDIKPRPNWLNIGLVAGLALLGSLIVYGYLVMNLIEMLTVP